MKKVSKGHLLPGLRMHSGHTLHAVPFLVVSAFFATVLLRCSFLVIEIINMDLEYLPESHGPRSSLNDLTAF